MSQAYGQAMLSHRDGEVGYEFGNEWETGAFEHGAYEDENYTQFGEYGTDREAPYAMHPEVGYETAYEDEGEEEYGGEFAHEFGPEMGYETHEFASRRYPAVEGEYGFFEDEDEGAFETEGFFEDESEGFIKKFKKLGRLVKRFTPIGKLGKLASIAKGVGRFVGNNGGLFKSLAKRFAPIVATAIGGPAAGKIASLAANALLKENEALAHELAQEMVHESAFNESAFLEAALQEVHEMHQEIHHELSHELTMESGHEIGYEAAFELSQEIAHELGHEFSHELAMEMAQEAAHEIAGETTHAYAHPEMAAELLASAAAEAVGEAEAARYARAAMTLVLSRRDRAALSRLRRELTAGAALITRLLRRHPRGRVAVRALPLIARQATGILARHAARGSPLSRRTVGRALASSFQRVLTNPTLCGRAILRNYRITKVQPAILRRLRRPGRLTNVLARSRTGRPSYTRNRGYGARSVRG